MESAFSGEGAKRYGGRFNRPETALVYAASSLALAVLEMMANTNDYDRLLLKQFVAIPATIDTQAIIHAVVSADNVTWTVGKLSASIDDWRSEPPPRDLQQLGSTWAHQKMSVALRVPSAVIPHEYNYPLNPNHADFSQIEIGEPVNPLIDPRLADG